MKNKRAIQHRIEYIIFRSLICFVEALPTRTGIRLAEMLGYLFAYILPKKWTRYKVARENLRRAFGESLSEEEIQEIFYKMWVHLFRLVIEIPQHTRKMRLYNCADILQFRYRDYSTQALCCGRPIILLSGHFGNWEIANTTFGLFGYPAGVVARDLDNPYLHQWFVKFRQFTGHRLISKKGGGTDMTELMEQGGMVALLGDQDAGKRGLFVPFFGHDASTFKSIALLSIQMDAPILVGYTLRLPDNFVERRWTGFEMGCADVIDPRNYENVDAIRGITEDYTLALERSIRRAPEQYFWVHRRWKSEPRQKKKKTSEVA
ncbi:MAG: lysophospholipid acyltransferase family protein [Planctomycetaceae bacterium]